MTRFHEVGSTVGELWGLKDYVILQIAVTDHMLNMLPGIARRTPRRGKVRLYFRVWDKNPSQNILAALATLFF